jgi:hypothetical protein
MQSELKTETVEVFNYRVLEELIKELYSQEIHILQDLISEHRIGQYTYHEYDVTSDEDYGYLLGDIDDPMIAEEWIQTGQMPYRDDYEGFPRKALQVEHILYRLHKEGHIPTGKYLMTVHW